MSIMGGIGLWLLFCLLCWGISRARRFCEKLCEPPPPPPPPEYIPTLTPLPPTKAEKAAALKVMYDETLAFLESAGLDATELRNAKAEVKRQYLRELDGIMR